MWQQLIEPSPARLYVLGQDHFAHIGDTVTFEEHMFGTAQADALGAPVAGAFGILRGIGVGPDLQ